MRKILLMMQMCVLLFIPAGIYAEPGDDWGNGGGKPHLIPTRLLAQVSYDESDEQLSVTFRRAVEDACLYVYKDGYLTSVDYLAGTVAGTTYSYSASESGVYTVVLQIGDSNITLFEETIYVN